jgi:hypothetical protein
MSIADTKDLVQICFQGVSTAAILVGGIIALFKYVIYRQTYPKINVTSSIDAVQLDEQHVLVRVTATIDNLGPRMLKIEQGYANLLLVSPCDTTTRDQLARGNPNFQDNLLELPLLDKKKLPLGYPREIEPQESDQIHFDFVVQSNIEVVCACINVANPSKSARSIVWEKRHLFRIPLALQSSGHFAEIGHDTEQAMERKIIVNVERVVEKQASLTADPRPVDQPVLPAGEQTKPKSDPRPVQPPLPRK